MTISDYINNKEDKNAKLAILDCNGCIIVEDDFRNYIEPYNFSMSIQGNDIEDVAVAMGFIYDVYCLQDFEIVDGSERLVKAEINYLEDVYLSDNRICLKRPINIINTYGIMLEDIFSPLDLNICCCVGRNNRDFYRVKDYFYRLLENIRWRRYNPPGGLI